MSEFAILVSLIHISNFPSAFCVGWAGMTVCSHHDESFVEFGLSEVDLG